MKQNIKEFRELYKNYMSLKKAIEGPAYLSDDGILIEREKPADAVRAGGKGETA